METKTVRVYGKNGHEDRDETPESIGANYPEDQFIYADASSKPPSILDGLKGLLAAWKRAVIWIMPRIAGGSASDESKIQNAIADREIRRATELIARSSNPQKLFNRFFSQLGNAREISHRGKVVGGATCGTSGDDTDHPELILWDERRVRGLSFCERCEQFKLATDNTAVLAAEANDPGPDCPWRGNAIQFHLNKISTGAAFEICRDCQEEEEEEYA